MSPRNEHRAATGMWQSPAEDSAPGNIPADPFKTNPRFRPQDWADVVFCDALAHPIPFMCGRQQGHPGRHIALGHTRVCAAWPGTHEPTLDDLGTPPTAEVSQP